MVRILLPRLPQVTNARRALDVHRLLHEENQGATRPKIEIGEVRADARIEEGRKRKAKPLVNSSPWVLALRVTNVSISMVSHPVARDPGVQAAGRVRVVPMEGIQLLLQENRVSHTMSGMKSAQMAKRTNHVSRMHREVAALVINVKWYIVI